MKSSTSSVTVVLGGLHGYDEDFACCVMTMGTMIAARQITRMQAMQHLHAVTQRVSHAACTRTRTFSCGTTADIF
jgi:hypothetical protein